MKIWKIDLYCVILPHTGLIMRKIVYIAFIFLGLVSCSKQDITPSKSIGDSPVWVYVDAVGNSIIDPNSRDKRPLVDDVITVDGVTIIDPNSRDRKTFTDSFKSGGVLIIDPNSRDRNRKK